MRDCATKLAELLDHIHELPDSECIFARKPWPADSEAVTALLGEKHEVPSDITTLGFEYFLKVHVAKEVLEVLSGRKVSKDEKLRLLIFYAENDAYPDWVYKL